MCHTIQPNMSRRNSIVEFDADTTKQCLKQVEFYFSEFNFPYDKFLKTTAEQNDGWVPISTIATFNRMKKYRPMDKVVEILKGSKILQVSDDGENVRRSEPLQFSSTKELRLEQDKRTLILFNVPFDFKNEKIHVLQEELENFLNKINDNIVQIRFKRDKWKRFHGMVKIEFDNEENCIKFINSYSNDENDHDKEILSFKNKRLNIMSKKQYDLQREATKSKNFSGSGQRSRSFTGHRKNMPILTKPKDSDNNNSAIDDTDDVETEKTKAEEEPKLEESKDEEKSTN